MAEPYSPSSETRFFPGSANQGARLSTRDELLPSRQNSHSGPSRKNSRSSGQPQAQAQAQGQSEGQAQGEESKDQPNPQMDLIKKTQKEIDAVTEQLHQNIEMMQERGERLDNLQVKSDQLSLQSQRFKTQATTIRRQMWWKNLKWTICLGILLVVIIAGAVGGGIKGKQVIEEHQTITYTETAQTATQSITPTKAV